LTDEDAHVLQAKRLMTLETSPPAVAQTHQIYFCFETLIPKDAPNDKSDVSYS
jgi:hypothetical protein